MRKHPYLMPEAEVQYCLSESLICDSETLTDPDDYVDGGDPFTI